MSARPRSIFDWDHMLLYLSGAMDFADDRGGGWRGRITRKLVEIGIPAERILDPSKKPSCTSHKLVNADEGELLDQHRAAKDWDGLVRTMKVVAHFDLRCVDKSDFIIASFPRRGRGPLEADLTNFDRSYDAVREYIGRGQGEDAKQARNDLRHLRDVFTRTVEMVANAHVPTYGTLHEIVVARQQKKPVFVIWESDGMSTCSAWVMWLVGHRNVFKSMEACVNRIDRLMHHREPLDMDDWLLFALPGSDAPDARAAAPTGDPPPQEGPPHAAADPKS